MGKQSTVQRSALLKLPCNALFISVILPDRRQIYSFYYLAVIESVSLRVRKISITKSQNQFAEMLLKPLPVVFGLQNDENATRGALWRSLGLSACSGEPPAPKQVTYAGSRSIAAPRDGVLLPVGREPHRQPGVPNNPLALLCRATAPLVTAWC